MHAHTHTHTHSRTHARTHARTTTISPSLPEGGAPKLIVLSASKPSLKKSHLKFSVWNMSEYSFWMRSVAFSENCSFLKFYSTVFFLLFFFQNRLRSFKYFVSWTEKQTFTCDFINFLLPWFDVSLVQKWNAVKMIAGNCLKVFTIRFRWKDHEWEDLNVVIVNGCCGKIELVLVQTYADEGDCSYKCKIVTVCECTLLPPVIVS